MESVGSNSPSTVAASNGITTKTIGSEMNLSAHELDSPVSLDLKLPTQADGTKQSNDQPRVFQCKFCTAKFAKHQALGGHQRAHRRAYPDYYRFQPYSNGPYYGYSNSSLHKPSRLVLPSTALPFSSIHRPRIESLDTPSHINGDGKNTHNLIVNFGASSPPNFAGKVDIWNDSLIRNPWTASTSNGTAYSNTHRPRNESFNAVGHINGFGANKINSLPDYDACSSTNHGGLIQLTTDRQAECEASDEVDQSGIDLSLKL